MKIDRPLSIIQLKIVFLKVLYEFHVKTGNLLPCRAIFRMIPDYFKIESLSNEEYKSCFGAVKELMRDGYIKLVSKKDDTYTLTGKGVGVAVKNINDIKIQQVDLRDLLTPRFDLLRKVRPDYFIGDFEDAIFKAYKLLEVKVRLKSQQAESVYGVKLMDMAFKPKNGLLKHPNVMTKPEQEGIHFLMRGAISFFKNPSSHRTVDWNDPNKTAHVLAFAKFLLDLVDKCELVKK